MQIKYKPEHSDSHSSHTKRDPKRVNKQTWSCGVNKIQLHFSMMEKIKEEEKSQEECNKHTRIPLLIVALAGSAILHVHGGGDVGRVPVVHVNVEVSVDVFFVEMINCSVA